MNRKLAPPIHAITNLRLPRPVIHTLDNGVTVYETSMGTQDVVRLEIVFYAGRPQEHKHLVSRSTLGLLREGAGPYSAAEIAEILDYYGSSLSTPFNMDSANLVLYALSHQLDKVLPLLVAMLETPAFPAEELDAFIQRNLKLLAEDLSKPDVVAYRQITELIFGPTHPYGYNSWPETYAQLHRDDLVHHFNTLYTCDNCEIFISGKITPEIIALLNRTIGAWNRRGKVPPFVPPPIHTRPEKQWLTKPSGVQSAIRIGRRLFDRRHPDYCGMFVLSTMLGGYFGSRLMANIREEKGYTYNIYATLDTMRFDGCFYIGTEVGNEFVKDTVQQIYKEIELLRTQPADVEEMEMVRSYLMGSLLTMLDGPFNVGEVVRTMVAEDAPFHFFEELVATVETITAQQLQELANRYLQPDDLWEVIVG